MNEPTTAMEMVQWWEKRRLIYNVIIVPGTMLILWSMWKYVGNIMDVDEVIMGSIWGIVACNMFYTSAWVGGILRIHYFGGSALSSVSRWVLFSLGTLFTLIVIDLHFTFSLDVIFAGY